MSAGVEPTNWPASGTDPAAAPFTSDRPAATTPPALPLAGFAFAAATFLGAFLLFFVQPMIAKYILPWFGGGAAVWTTCLLFFQAVLLGGYLYAHLGVSHLGPRAQALPHGALLVAAVLLSLPAIPSERWKPVSGEASPIVGILSLLAATVGLPCLVLAATSPLLHAWFGRVRPGAKSDVYRMYALSNAGSLLALVSYPFLFEPALPRRTQAHLWSVGLGVYAVVCAYCAWCAAVASRRPVVATDATLSEAAGEHARLTFGRRLLWVLLPACASVLLLAGTNTMTQDLAPVPFLWVLPLSLYLLTFIIAFADRRVYRRSVFGWVMAVGAAAITWMLFQRNDDLSIPMTGRIAVMALGLFLCCLVLHGELAELKPDPRHLTGYYLAIAAGGVVGGSLVAVAAPLVFDRFLEMQIGLWLACLLVVLAPYLSGARGLRPRPNDEQAAHRGGSPINLGPTPALTLTAVAGLIVLGGVLWTSATLSPGTSGKVVRRARDFYGPLAVILTEDPQRPAENSYWLIHGTIIHGHMYAAPSRRNRPTSYYGPTSGAGIAMAHPTHQGRPRRVGVVGLGAGAVARHARKGDVFRFYEISPAVLEAAKDPFTHLSDTRAAGVEVDVVLGDGRVSLEREGPQRYDVLILDAFSSDAIPLHLLTVEAFDRVYRKHLAPGGVVAVNITNRHIHLLPVLARVAGHLGWSAAFVRDDQPDTGTVLLSSDWVILSPDPAVIDGLEGKSVRRMRPDPKYPLWTDERTSILKLLK